LVVKEFFSHPCNPLKGIFEESDFFRFEEHGKIHNNDRTKTTKITTITTTTFYENHHH